MDRFHLTGVEGPGQMSELRSGITTGTCAAAAAQAAARVLCGLPAPDRVEIPLPQGRRLAVPILYARQTSVGSAAAVRKDAGDDPDVTDGMEVVVTLCWAETSPVEFVAGEGVGTVTKPGLQVPPGQPAINPVPQEMITQAIREVTDRPVRVEVSIPGGREVARRTFNPRLGIVGGLSILGTTGIVRPYCERAVQDSVRCAVDVAAACEIGSPILVAGNIGSKAAEKHFATAEQQVIEVANQWGFALDQVACRRFDALLLLGHPGKLAKFIRGQWDTHSSRSERAVGLVAQIAAEVLSEPLMESETVEGIFGALPAEQRRRAGDEIARQIRLATEDRMDRVVPVATFLVDMAGNCVGTSGELSPWQ